MNKFASPNKAREMFWELSRLDDHVKWLASRANIRGTLEKCKQKRWPDEPLTHYYGVPINKAWEKAVAISTA